MQIYRSVVGLREIKMNVKIDFPRTWENMQRLQRKISIKLEREQYDLPKRARKLSRSKPIDALREIYEYVDRFFSGAANLVACRKGCANCCHGRVWTTQLEADLIAETHALDIPKIDEIMDSDTFVLRDSSRPCPFLSSEQTCTIYSVRPLVCRTHFNFEATNVLCQYENADKKMPLLDRSKTIPGVLNAIEEANSVNGGAGGDIRRYFGDSRVDVTVRITHVLSGQNKSR